jgi:hypothetical protein
MRWRDVERPVTDSLACWALSLLWLGQRFGRVELATFPPHAARQAGALACRPLTEQGLVIGSWIFPGGDEFKLVQMCSYLPMPIAGFGSSDCATCRSHLLQWSSGTALLLPD